MGRRSQLYGKSSPKVGIGKRAKLYGKTKREGKLDNELKTIQNRLNTSTSIDEYQKK